MDKNLIAPDRLGNASKILFITHLALGDFTYLQNCFEAFHRAFPHIAVHLWVDEVRRTSDSTQWDHLKKYSLYDWTAACSCFEKVYTRTYSPALFEESISEAQRENYPLVVSLATLRPHQYARLARRIGPNGFVAGMKERSGFRALFWHAAYRQLDAVLSADAGGQGGLKHISDVYADWFYRLFGVELAAEARLPFVHIPEQWTRLARQTLRDWGFAQRSGKLIFINPYAKTKKRCWPLERVAELIEAMSGRDEWHDACFIINAMPHERAGAEQVFEKYGLKRTHMFSADKNFFQLPAMLSECDLIVSVETAVMHLANAVHVPVVALMRQKNPEWVPLDSANSTVITASRRRDWVKEIAVEQVMSVL